MGSLQPSRSAHRCLHDRWYGETRLTDRNSFIAPRAGLVTILLAALWAVVIGCFWESDPAVPAIALRVTGLLAAVGILYGMVGWICWTLAALSNLWLRALASLAVAVAASYSEWKLLGGDINSREMIIKHAISFGGLMLSQSMIFFWLAIPDWGRGRQSPTANLSRQYTIGGVLVITLGTAILLAAARRYVPPITPTEYWLWLLALWTVLPLTSAGIATRILHLRRDRRTHCLIGATTLAMSASIALGIADARFGNGGTQWVTAAYCYGVIIFSSMAVVGLMGLAGRWDAVGVLADSDPQPPADDD